MDNDTTLNETYIAMAKEFCRTFKENDFLPDPARVLNYVSRLDLLVERGFMSKDEQYKIIRMAMGLPTDKLFTEGLDKYEQ